ncbi:MAG: HNH endonuclease [Chloroflexota bacterium]
MKAIKISRRLIREVRQRANHRCEYCQSSEWLTGQPFTIDHIIPRAREGATISDNLCLACAPCNGYKLDQVEAVDPESGKIVPLFNARQQQWQDHFTWSVDGTEIIGLTSCGRATMAALKLNRPLVVSARATWVATKRHPPSG